MLFATLETSTRAIKLLNNKEFLVTDTVGFVSKLPHYLVESFKSTLEEINEALKANLAMKGLKIAIVNK